MTSAKDLIMGTACPAMSFNYRGDKIVGTILTEPKAVQQTIYDPRNPSSKELAFWPSGDPKMQVVFQVQTQWRNYEGIGRPDRTKPDDGRRTIYLKGKHMERATGDAIRAAGAEWLDIGGMVSFEYIGDDMESIAGIKPKLFAVRYRAPAPQAPQHFNQQQGYPVQGQPQQQPPRPPQPAHPAPNPAEAYAAYQRAQQQAQAVQRPQDPGPMNPGPYGLTTTPYDDPWATPVPPPPPHHGAPEAMPDWASAPTSAVPSSAPPAPPSLSTLEMIRQAGQVDSGGLVPNEAGF